MTLDFKKLVLNGVRKQMTIQHFECNAQIFKKDELPEAVLAKIQEKFGQDFVEDANYTLWFSGEGITKETVEKTIFKIVNSALGSSANNMNESDLKMIDLGGGAAAEPPPGETATEAPSLSDPGADAANAQAVADLVGGDEDSEEGGDDSDEVDREIKKELDADFGPEDGEDDEDDDEEPGDDEDDDEESEDDEELDESVEQPASGEKFVFLKITMK